MFSSWKKVVDGVCGPVLVQPSRYQVLLVRLLELCVLSRHVWHVTSCFSFGADYVSDDVMQCQCHVVVTASVDCMVRRRRFA